MEFPVKESDIMPDVSKLEENTSPASIYEIVVGIVRVVGEEKTDENLRLIFRLFDESPAGSLSKAIPYPRLADVYDCVILGYYGFDYGLRCRENLIDCDICEACFPCAMYMLNKSSLTGWEGVVERMKFFFGKDDDHEKAIKEVLENG